MKNNHDHDAHAGLKYKDIDGNVKEKTYYSKTLSGRELYEKKADELKKKGATGICGSSHNAW